MSGYRRRQDKKRLYKGLGIAAAVLIVGIVFVALVLGMADHYRFNNDNSVDSRDTITYKDQTYTRKGNIETYLITGIDSPGKVQELKEYDGTGQCDVLVVIVRDRSTDECKLLTIDRNTITEVKSLDDDGTCLATTDIQISLAHSMGLDQKVRAENTVDAVSHLLGNATIDGYAMVNMGAISVVNDMVGGVTVTVEDDFSEVDPTLKMGETVTLMGEHAENYVRQRKEVADGRNENRMHRQSSYEEAFKPAFRTKCNEDNKFPLEVYHALEEYMTTDISAKKFCRLALLLSDENMNQKEQNEEMEIDLLDLAYMLLDNWHYLLICLLAGALLLNAYSFFCIQPTYQSTSKLYIVSTSDDSVVNLNDLNLGTSLTSDYEELMLSYPVLNRVIEKLDLDMDYNQLKQLYTLNNPTDTRVLQITATTTDPQLSMDLAETMAVEAVSYLPDTMSTKAPNIAQHAKLPEYKAAPSYSRYTMMGGLLGLILCAGVLIVRYLMDDTIHTAEDMEKYFGLVPLTVIPESDQVAQMETTHSSKKKRRKKNG